jgi:cell wall-associated NlpC family hydrolase
VFFYCFFLYKFVIVRKIIFFFTFLLFQAAFCREAADKPLSVSDSAEYAAAKADSLIRISMRYLGMKYCGGGRGAKNCFDCSGFVSQLYADFGISLPHTSAGIAVRGTGVKDREDIRPGDVVYFKGSNLKSRQVGHVGIVVQNDRHSVFFIHASVRKGICLDDLDDAYYQKRFLGARRFF